jgi:carboxyl-terminal processing protease
MTWKTLLAGVVLTAACTGPLTTSPTTTPASTSTIAVSTSTSIAPASFTACTGEGELALLCEGYELIRDHYVDPLDDHQLAVAAAGAVEGLEDGAFSNSFTCTVPTQDFALVCQTIVEDGIDPRVGAEAALAGMVDSLDPNSVYLDPEALRVLEEDQSGRVEGIGALVTSEDLTAEDPRTTPCGVISETCRLVIVSVLEGSPAKTAGLRADDVIVAVNGNEIDGWTVDEVTAEVRGPAGTEVRVEVEREGERVGFIIVRAAITVPVVESTMVGGTGYLRLNLFTERSDAEFRRALEGLLAGGAKRLILDLRDNPGGSLDATVNIASEFLAEGLVVRTIAPGEEVEYRVERGGLATDPTLPVLVLVNRGSASASEVVTAALQEAGRVTVIGEATFGKNTVQQRYDLSNGGALKLTIARWVTPGGLDFGEIGVLPDVEADLSADLTVEELVAAVDRLSA